MDNNVYIVRCRQTGDACSSTPPTSTISSSTSAARLGVRQVVETHGHWDHIQAVQAVRDAGFDVAVTAEPTRACSRPTTSCSRTATSSRSAG